MSADASREWCPLGRESILLTAHNETGSGKRGKGGRDVRKCTCSLQIHRKIIFLTAFETWSISYYIIHVHAVYLHR